MQRAPSGCKSTNRYRPRVLLRLAGVAKSFGARSLFRGVDLHVAAGDRVGLVGRNGAGKTSLLRIAAGDDEPDAGSVFRSRGVEVGMLRQEIDPRSECSVLEEASRATERIAALERELSSLEGEMTRCGERGEAISPDLAERYDRARSAFSFAGGFEREARVLRVLAGLGFAPADLEQPLSALSGGWRMRVELAKLLLAAPDVLLLDEPTNHLDLASIQWFEETLAGYAGGVIVISHDRAFLRRHANRMAELEAGQLFAYGVGYDAYRREREARLEGLRAHQRQQQREVAQVERFVERFRYKASKAKQVQSRIKALDKLERIGESSGRAAGMRLRIPEPARSGRVVLTLSDVHKRYGDRVVYAGVDFSLERGEKVALVGPNGAGKSTLLRLAAGVLELDRGERTLGHRVDLAFYAQHQLSALDPAGTVLEQLGAVASTEDVPRLRSHLGAFLFSGDDVDKKVAVLSGGEKARLALARLLLRPVNFLVLDEPTNHLDVESCEVLEEALASYAGTLLFISHDRDLLDALCTRVVEVRDGTLTSTPGGYRDTGRRGEPGEPAATRGEPAARSATKQERMAERERSRARLREIERAKKRVAAVEEEILELEERSEELAQQLTLPEVYSDGDFSRAVQAERSELRARIQELYGHWETAAAELEAQSAGGGAECSGGA